MPPRAVSPEVWRVEVDRDDPARGARDARVTLVVFSDFECPHCRRMAAVLEGALERHSTTLEVVWKDYPLSRHAHAEPAALLARYALAQGGAPAFWAMHDAIFEAQPELGEPTLERLAREAGLDWRQARESLRTREHGVPIYRSLQLGRRLGVEVTPTVFVNGRKIAGVPSPATLDTVINEEAAKAEELVGTGVAPSDVHGVTVREGRQDAAASDL